MSFKDIIGEQSVVESIFDYKENAKRIELNDGESISVQASGFHYCSPRDNAGPYYAVECGYPSVRPQEEMMEYVENYDEPTETVYGYVPIQVVQDFINLHGGEKDE